MCLLFRKNAALKKLEMKQSVTLSAPLKLVVYGVLFVLCLGCVAHIIPVWIMVVILLTAVLIVDRTTLKFVDYSLLLTFVGFFIFIGNMGRIPAFSSFLETIIKGNEIVTAALASQVISNVPAALLLSGFTNEWSALIIGTNIGGLGTLIASMASLISYRFIVSARPEDKGRYMLYFSGVNVAFLAVFLGISRLI